MSKDVRGQDIIERRKFIELERKQGCHRDCDDGLSECDGASTIRSIARNINNP